MKFERRSFTFRAIKKDCQAWDSFWGYCQAQASGDLGKRKCNTQMCPIWKRGKKIKEII